MLHQSFSIDKFSRYKPNGFPHCRALKFDCKECGHLFCANCKELHHYHIDNCDTAQKLRIRAEDSKITFDIQYRDSLKITFDMCNYHMYLYHVHR
jgi:hypothetical protein